MSYNNPRIDLTPYFNTTWTVQLEDSFRLKLKNKIKERFTIQDLSNLTSKSVDSIWKFHEGKYNANLSYLLKLSSLLNISKQELIKNIKEIYPRVKKGSFKTKYLEINPLFVEWYSAWIGEGDHSKNREAISLTNYSINLLELHIKILVKLGFDKERIKAEIISPHKEEKNKIKERWSKILNLPSAQITTISYMENATQEGARIEIWCAGLFRILHKIDDKIKSVIKISNNKIKIAYLKGIFAAEGSVRKKGKEIRLNMKNRGELLFVRYLLVELGIRCRPITLNISNNCYELSILGFRDIKKFKEINGFGLNSKRKELLDKTFKTYDNKLPWYERFEQVKQILLKKKEITNLELMESLNTTYFNTSYLTRMFTKQGLLKSDKSNKIYKYSLIDTCYLKATIPKESLSVIN